MTRAPLIDTPPRAALAKVSDVCTRYRISPNRLRQACREGRVPFYRVGNVHRFDLDVLDALFLHEATQDLDGSLVTTPAGRRRPAPSPREASPPAG